MFVSETDIGVTDDPKTKILMDFHRAVYTIMFAIRNKHKMEKKQRSRYYANLWKKEDNEMDEDDDDYMDDDQSEDPQNNFISNPSIQNYTDQPVLDKINIMQKQTEQEKIEDKTSLRDNLNQNGENQSEQQMINNEEITDNKQNLANSDDENENQQEDEDDDEEDDEEAIPVTLQFPPDTASRISYILFFPFHLILFLLPNYHINPSLLKLFKCLICNLIFLGLTLFLIEWWVNEIAKSLGFNNEIIGFLFVSFGLSFPFIRICNLESLNKVLFYQSPGYLVAQQIYKQMLNKKKMKIQNMFQPPTLPQWYSFSYSNQQIAVKLIRLKVMHFQ
ncbi:hypothetical protein PPERSA_00350 [Pseudocohnilembus persalinus]|uniref:Transmembrane protein n=1 Tax=Pseudocohnilembus persalinus TaxID=266149 RepID=A0A0V0QXV8_PSEPJ|nr:hypothetical protein PPERSA_00350 [Pseudocohnilembus persalinus]|eukprot:KRX07193.1 hypothetical protein PPERSA_00350 [Pseudocohnilembus persalinus]